MAMQTNNNGGSNETEVKEFAVNPRGEPSVSVVVMIVTPVAKFPNASLRERLLSGFSYILEFKERHVSEGRGPGTLLKLTRFERGCGRQRGVVAALGQTLNVAPLEILRPAVE